MDRESERWPRRGKGIVLHFRDELLVAKQWELRIRVAKVEVGGDLGKRGRKMLATAGVHQESLTTNPKPRNGLGLVVTVRLDTERVFPFFFLFA